MESPEVHDAPPGPQRKKKSRGVRLTKAEREARQQQRLTAAADDIKPGAAFEARRGRLLLHVSRCEWNEACQLGQESVQLAHELMGALIPLGRHKLLTHCAARMSATVTSDSLLGLVQRALDDGQVAAAVAVARGIGVLDRIDVAEHVLRAYEAGRVQEAVDAIGGEAPLQLRVLRAMVEQSRCLQYAVQYLPSLRELPTPDVRTLERWGKEAESWEAEAEAEAEAPVPSTTSRGASLPTEVRAAVEVALRRVWPGCTVHLFGSSALGLASASSDIDACVLLPSASDAHCRDGAGRAKVRPLLPLAVAALRGSEGMSGVLAVPKGRTPLVRFEYDGSMACASVELCINNTDGLANTFVMRELLNADAAGVRAPLRTVATVVRRWSKRRRLCGPEAHTVHASTYVHASTFVHASSYVHASSARMDGLRVVQVRAAFDAQLVRVELAGRVHAPTRV